DKIQGLVSRYASDLFEIGIAFPQLDGREYPVIIVSDGVRTPVAAKADLIGSGGKPLIRVGDVYFRTLNANGTPSTAVAKPQDWREIIEVCFENREADVGRFLRRQLGGQDISNIVTALKSIGIATAETEPTDFKVGPSLKDRTLAFLTDGKERF